MLTRERLWRRLSGAGFWGLPWGLAAACGLPWVVPERWQGHCPGAAAGAGWLLVLATAPLAWRRRWAWLALGLALAWGTLGSLGRQARWEAALPTGFQRVEGMVCAPWRLRGGLRAGRIRLRAPGALRAVELPLTLPSAGVPPPGPGTPVAFRGELKGLEPGPAFLPERPLWRARCGGSPRRCHLASALLLEPLGPARPGPWLRFQAFIQGRFDQLPLGPGLARDLWGALTLGLPPVHDEAFSPFAESGTIHTLVVSGLQVTLVMGGLEALWRRLLLRGGWHSLSAAAAGGLAYCGVVGFSAPVWRGLLMGLAVAAGQGSGWKLPPVLTLHGALLLWLLTHPAAGAEPGFLLAWLALVGLVWGAEPLAGLCAPFLRRFSLPFAQVLAPWLSTLPLLALLHGGAPLWGVPANLVLLPLVAVLAPLGLALVLVPVPWAVGALGALLTWTGGRLVPGFARVSPLATGVLWPWVALVLGWLLLAHLQARFMRTRWLATGLLGATLLLLATRGTGRAPGTLSLEAMDIGQGDALLLRVPGGPATLVDTGPDPRGARRIVRILSRRGVREPVHLVLTHPHLDHAGGWATLARLWPLASVSLPPLGGPARAWAPYGPPGAAARATPLVRGRAWTRGEAAFAVRWPPGALDVKDFNMLSAVLRVRWRDRELWLMGDALALQEEDLLALGEPGEPVDPGQRDRRDGPGGRGPAPARLLKAGHHGSRSASAPAWVRALDPGLVLVCAGRANAFGHPHPEAMRALAARGAEVRVTGPEAGVRASAEPGGWRVVTGAGAETFVPFRSGEGATGKEGRNDRLADPGMVGPPFCLGLGAHPVGHGQDRGAGDPCRLAGREDPGQFKVFGGGVPGQQLGPRHGPGHAGGDRHRVRRERARCRGRPPGDLDLRPVGPPLQDIQGQGQGLRGADEVPGLEPIVIGATGAHEEDPAGGQFREQARGRHGGGKGAHPGAGDPPALGGACVQAREFGGEGGEEEGGGGCHRLGVPVIRSMSPGISPGNIVINHYNSNADPALNKHTRASRPSYPGQPSWGYFCSSTACAAARMATGTR